MCRKTFDNVGGLWFKIDDVKKCISMTYTIEKKFKNVKILIL